MQGFIDEGDHSDWWILERISIPGLQPRDRDICDFLNPDQWRRCQAKIITAVCFTFPYDAAYFKFQRGFLSSGAVMKSVHELNSLSCSARRHPPTIQHILMFDECTVLCDAASQCVSRRRARQRLSACLFRAVEGYFSLWSLSTKVITERREAALACRCCSSHFTSNLFYFILLYLLYRLLLLSLARKTFWTCRIIGKRKKKRDWRRKKEWRLFFWGRIWLVLM